MKPGRSIARKALVVLLVVGVAGSAALGTVFLLGQGLDRADKWAGVFGGYALAGTAFAAVWTRVTRRPERSVPPAPAAAAYLGPSLAVPARSAPPQVRGRDQVLGRLRAAARRPAGALRVLTGLGGVGKSTIAAAVCRSGGRQVWWISARDTAVLADGLAGLAAGLGADHAHLTAIRAAAPRAWARLWELLATRHRAWILVLDNVDDEHTIEVLLDSGPARAAGRGLVLITSRIGETAQWGTGAVVEEVGLLAERDAAQVLLDMAPRAGDREAARRLARALGHLPLALHLAGSNLGSRVALWTTFDDYRQALGRLGLSQVLGTGRAGRPGPDHRGNVMLTWEMSLTALAEGGWPECRPLLRLLSWCSPIHPLPTRLLHAEPLLALLGLDSAGGRSAVHDRLEKLANLHLVTAREILVGGAREGGAREGGAREQVLRLHPVVAETNRANAAGDPTLRTAVELMTLAVERLRFDDNRDWPHLALLAPHVQELLKHAEAGNGLERLLTAAAHVVAFHAWSGHEATAEAFAHEALARAAPLAADHPARLHLRGELAWAAGLRGHWDRAELEAVRAARTRVLGAGHADTLDSRHKLAWAVGRLGDWPTAERQLRPVYEARVALLGPEHPDTLHSRCCLAWVAGACGRPDEAEAAYLDIIETRSRVLGTDHVETLDAQHSLGELFIHLERFADAERVLRRVVAERVRIVGAAHPETLDNRPRYWLALALRGQGRHRAATRLLRKLLEDQTRQLEPGHAATEDTRRQLARPENPGSDASAAGTLPAVFFTTLDRYTAADPTEATDLARVRALRDEAEVFARTVPLHITGSAVVVHPPTGRVLLRWHARQSAWLQIGGHVDPGEDDPLRTALREGQEETGLPDLAPWPNADILHVVVVSVTANEREPAHEHADVRYVLSTATPESARPENPAAELRWLTIPEAMALTAEANLRESLSRVQRLMTTAG